MADIKTFIDMNYWFYVGCSRHIEVNEMMTNTGDGSSMHIFWNEFDQAKLKEFFLPNSIFQLLYTDEVDDDFVVVLHKFDNLDRARFFDLPRRLITLFDCYYHTKSFYTVLEDTDNTLESILVDPIIEYTTLEFLLATRKAIKANPSFDPDVDLPLTTSDFIDQYITNFNDHTNLEKAIILELYYLVYKQQDGYAIYNACLDIVPTLEGLPDNNEYNLMTLLYFYMTVNRILKNDIIDNPNNKYITDYWDNN